MADATGYFTEDLDDFTFKFFYPKTIDEVVPQDGKWHNVKISRSHSILHLHFDKEIDGVLFVAHEQRNESGELIEAHYIRADLVNG